MIGAQPESMRLEYGGCQVLITCPTGASHQEKGQPCQDACMVTQGYHRGVPYTFLAVADGHGSPEYDRSDVGSHLAVAAAWIAISDLIVNLATLSGPQRGSDSFRQIRHDVEHYLGKRILQIWQSQVGRHAGYEHACDEVVGKEHALQETGITSDTRRYGSTLALVLLLRPWFIAATLGDGGVFRVDLEGVVEEIAPLLPGSAGIGLATDSLASAEAQYRWRFHVGLLSDASMGMLLLTTDGLLDSLEDPKASISDILQKKQKHGLDWLEGTLPGQLQRWSQNGVGDDMACIVLFPDTPPRKLQTAVGASAAAVPLPPVPAVDATTAELPEDPPYRLEPVLANLLHTDTAGQVAQSQTEQTAALDSSLYSTDSADNINTVAASDTRIPSTLIPGVNHDPEH